MTDAQDQIKSVRAELAQVQGGSLSPQLQQNLKTLQTKLADLQTKVASLEKKVKSAEGKAPSQLQGRLAKLDTRLSDLDSRLTARQDQIAAVLKDPSQANVQQLDASLASTEARITDPARSPGRAEPRGARRDEVQPARWSSDRCRGRSATWASCCPCWCSCYTWAPSTWRRGGVGEP